jgi:hypothetical protein
MVDLLEHLSTLSDLKCEFRGIESQINWNSFDFNHLLDFESLIAGAKASISKFNDIIIAYEALECHVASLHEDYENPIFQNSREKVLLDLNRRTAELQKYTLIVNSASDSITEEFAYFRSGFLAEMYTFVDSFALAGLKKSKALLERLNQVKRLL